MSFAPEGIESILDRAYQFRREGMKRDGRPPKRFVVTHDEFAALLRYYQGSAYQNYRITWVGPRFEVSVFGMEVCVPEFHPWAPGYDAMHHFKGYGRSFPNPEYLRFEEVSAPEVCETHRPLHPPREIPCPCGEVIWEYTGPIRPHPKAFYKDFGAVDSDKVSLQEWTAAVEDLVREVEPRG